MGLIKDIKDIESSNLNFYSSKKDWENAWGNYITKNIKVQLYDVTKNTSDELDLYFTINADPNCALTDEIFPAIEDIFYFLEQNNYINSFKDVKFGLWSDGVFLKKFDDIVEFQNSLLKTLQKHASFMYKQRRGPIKTIDLLVNLNHELNIDLIRIELL